MTESPDGVVILVADDDRDILDLVCFRLEMSGYRTLRARDGEEATRIARESAPDLCVLDVMMPKRNGFEVVQDLRADESTADIPVILLTATVQDKDVARGFEYGADDYLKKPFDPQELRARVAAQLRRRPATE